MNQQKTWQKIAPLWNQYKKLPNSLVIKFIKKQKGTLLDLGCGSGRNFTKTKAKIYAVDFSQQMLEFAKQKAEKLKINIEPIKAKAEKLPFKDNFFNSAIAIATIHCIKSKRKRKKALKELHRTLKPKSQALITVWDKQARRFRNKKKNMEVSWKIDGKRTYRYYYLYDQEEFYQLLEKVGFKIIKEIETKSNIMVVVEKI